MDFAEARTREGQQQLLATVGDTGELVRAELPGKNTGTITAEFLRTLIAFVPYHFRAIPTDRGLKLASRTEDTQASGHDFVEIHPENSIEHRLNKVRRRRTNGQVTSMNQPVMKATFQHSYCVSRLQLSKRQIKFPE